MKYILLVFRIRSFKRIHSYGPIPPPNGNTIHLALRYCRLNRGTWEGSLKPMSRQIKVRHFGCSQLGEDTFKNGYWVTRSPYGTWECGGVPEQRRVSSPQPSPPWLPLWKVQESHPEQGWGGKVCFLLPGVWPPLGGTPGMRCHSLQLLAIHRRRPSSPSLPAFQGASDLSNYQGVRVEDAARRRKPLADVSRFLLCHRTRPEWLGVFFDFSIFLFITHLPPALIRPTTLWLFYSCPHLAFAFGCRDMIQSKGSAVVSVCVTFSSLCLGIPVISR